MEETTIFGSGTSDEQAMAVLRRLLAAMPEPGTEKTTMEIAFDLLVPGQFMWEASRTTALSACAVLMQWGYLTRETSRAGNYTWTRTDKPAVELTAAHHEGRDRILAARAEIARQREQQGVAE